MRTHSLLRFSFLLAAAFAVPRFAAAQAIQVAEVKHEGPVDFEKEILPIFRRNCLACHSATEGEGGLVLENPQRILKGGRGRRGSRAGQGRREPADQTRLAAAKAADASAG